jgi:hypothetical protein
MANDISHIVDIAEGVAEPQAGCACSLSQFRIQDYRGNLYPAFAHRYLPKRRASPYQVFDMLQGYIDTVVLEKRSW